MPQSTNGILNIDGFHWSLLKMPDVQLASLPEKEQQTQRDNEAATFVEYYKALKNWIGDHDGNVWLTQGDLTIASGFPNIDEAVAAALSIQQRLTEFNHTKNRLPHPLIVRIGVCSGTAPNVPKIKRGVSENLCLDEAGHLQKDCPPGRVRISRKVYESLRYRTLEFRSSPIEPSKALSRDSLVSVERSLLPREVGIILRLTKRQKLCYPIMFTSRYHPLYGVESPCLEDVPETLPRATVILGETNRPGTSNGSPVHHPAPTSDSVGIIEILAALRTAPDVRAAIDEWVDTADLASMGHIVIVGSPVVSLYAHAVDTVSPVGFEIENSGLMRIRVDYQEERKFFPDTLGHADLDPHYGLVYVTSNPMNPNYRVLWLAGITGVATHAAARFVRDLVLETERVMNKLHQDFRVDRFNTAIVKAAYEKAISDDYPGGLWKVAKYIVVWAGLT